ILHVFDHKAVQELRVPSLASEVFGILAILILLLLCATGLLGNLLVCVAIKFDRRLHNITNYFLFSLTLTDLLVCSLVMPISLVVEVHEGMWKWSFPMCLLYVYADVFLCTASIVHMSVISLDRYLGISKPLKARDKSKTSITVKIASVWIATMLISCPIAIMALIDSSNIFNHNICRITNRSYMIYGSTFAFLIPFLIMVVTYVRTTSLLKQQPVITSHQGVATNNRSEAFIPKRAGIQRNYVSYYAETYANHFSYLVSTSENISFIIHLFVFQLKKNRSSNFRKRAEMIIFAIAVSFQATRVLAIVFICFFICWTPFFGANLAFGFCGERCALPPTIASFFLWLGYFSSTINPLIYTIFNRQFRRTFLRILRCQCTHSIRSTNGGHCYSRRTHNDYW
uniref:G_PROTEIN_RECEP_F1_2 domain-containing protein n=1 Tax=Elaeophora elaphi TaxID=1147741 RepID=A0A0R3S070_9BILA